MRHGKILWLGLVAVLALACQAGAAEVRYEAEDVIVNREALIPEKSAPDKWTVWSTDTNAHNWSGRVVVRAPAVLADRERPEDRRRHCRSAADSEDGVYTISPGGTRPTLGLSQTAARLGVVSRRAPSPER